MKTAENKKLRIFSAFILALVLFSLIILLRSCGAEDEGDQDMANGGKTQEVNYIITENDSLDDFGPEQRSQEEILDALNRQVENGMLTMTINPDPTFSDGKSEGNLLIENDTQNKHPLVVLIYRDDTKDLIYSSGLIPVGKHVNSDTLDVELAAGDYLCTAYFNAMDDTAGAVLGCGGVHITVHVQN